MTTGEGSSPSDESTRSEDRLWDLAEKLYERTRSNAIEWQTTNREDAFMYAGSGASVMIRSQDGDGVAPWQLAIFDDRGVEAEAISTYEQGEERRAMLYDLYVLARRNALNINKLVDSLFKELEE